MRTSRLLNIYSLLFALAIFLRVILIFNPGFEADISFWKSWGLATYDKGIVEGMKITNNNYPTPFAYTLGAMVWIYSRFADPHNFNEFWKNTNILFLAISKLFPILADFGIAGIIIYIGKHAKKLGFPQFCHSREPACRQAGAGNPEHNKLDPRVKPEDDKLVFGLSFYQLLAFAYLLNPLALIDGAWWGQVDSLGLFVFLLALVASLKRKPFLAGFIFILAMMTKLQNMIYGPIFFLYIFQLEGYDGLIKAIAGAVIGFFGLNIEFVLTRNMDRVLSSLTENFDYFPWMSLNAFNLWWIVSGAKGMATSDKLSIVGILNAKTIGLLLFSSFYLFAMLRQFMEAFYSTVIPGLTRNLSVFNTGSRLKGRDDNKKDARPVIQTFLENLILVNAAFFLFQTQSHDRYAFPLSVFLLLWAPFYLNTESRILNHDSKKKLWLFGILYAVFTIFYFYNLHTALVFNYSNNGLPLLSSLIQPGFTITTAFVLLGLFAIFLYSLIRSSQLTVYCLLFTVGLFISGLLFLNKPLITKQPIYLTKLTPYISEQAYGTRQTNRSVQSSFGGPNAWTRLSVQYAFYKTGIGTHANSKHVFDLNKQFKKFTTDFGIDTEAGTKASAIFELYGDDKLLFRSEKMGRFTLPKHADINVTGVKSLSLITTDAGDGNYDDHTDWLDPQLWP